MTRGVSFDWRDDLPIWKQIKDRLQGAIMDETYKEGDAIPSVRQLALDLKVNPLTISRAFQELVDEGLIEKRRGLGMFVAPNVAQSLLARERENFIKNEWPEILKRIDALGLSKKELLNTGGNND
ncbi:MAG: GntR family transcriptional regulator [Caulobacterales bacterium]|jgi:GntR family transcriptional regulator|nr:GntR family transcriptional regulator [Caulobacterales bacterium]MCA0372144.1 GntR family transcriptional regulator [Pseudomonadota bacterium]